MDYSWSNFSGKSFDLQAFRAYVLTIKWIGWKPQGIVFHNTGAPTLKQWVEWGPEHDQRILNLKHLYQDTDHWHAGPHIFSGRSHCTEFTRLTVPGVHASCFNPTHLGIEMPGDFSVEPFSSGDGALVQDNTAAIAAALYSMLGLTPDLPRAYLFHKDCPADHHNCPGAHVDRTAFRELIKHKMGMV